MIRSDSPGISRERLQPLPGVTFEVQSFDGDAEE
jgi:hypothetical protein